MNALIQSWRMLRREWRAGELRVLAAALVIAVGSMTSVGFFTDRIHRGMSQQAAELLAADLVIRSSAPIAADRAAQAEALGLASAELMTFPSVVLAAGRTQLVEVKAAGPGYPLRGRLRVASEPYGADGQAEDLPAPGEVWVDARALTGLELDVGAEIQLGAARLRIAKVLSYEPDRGGGMFDIAPRLLMRLDDVAGTELLGPGSRVRLALLLAGAPAALAEYRGWLTPRLTAGESLQDVRDARPELRVALTRAERFLGLAALVSVVLAGVAVASGARRYAARHLDVSAVLRCLGITQGALMRWYLLQMLWLGIAASLAGAALGFVAQEGLVRLMAGLLFVNLPPPSALPVLAGVLVGLITLLGFGLPPLMRLKDVPPARVLRRDLGVLPPRAITLYGAAVAAMAVLLLWQVSDIKLAGLALAGATGAVAVLLAAAWLLVRGLGRLRGRVGVAWRYGLANIARRAQSSVVQVLAFGLGIMVLLLLSIVRGDLLGAWQRGLPADAPNQFVVNVQPQQVAAMREFFAGRGVREARLHPMVRGRLVAINDRPVDVSDYEDDRAQRLARREFNLSWAAGMQEDNRIVAGRFWDESQFGRPVVSVEQGLADTLGLKLDDRLRFHVADRDIELTITSLRTVEWDSFRANFFVLAPPGVLEDFPATFITSFYLPAGERPLLGALVREFPNVTLIDVDAIMTKVRTIMDRVNLSVQYVFVFTLLAGLVVLYAAIQASRDERLYEGALLRTLGASRAQLWQGLAAEFLALGLLAGLLAALAASVTGFVLARQVFDLDYSFNPWVFAWGLGGGALGVGLFGLWGTRAVVRRPPLATLREI
ncbi:MAG TPA: FtsX-like permease family protein [Acidiferrobacterales bacterium]